MTFGAALVSALGTLNKIQDYDGNDCTTSTCRKPRKAKAMDNGLFGVGIRLWAGWLFV